MTRQEAELPYNIYLTGFMGTGKSTVADYLRKAFSMHVIDMDTEIERREKKNIPTIFKEDGEGRFRDLETALLEELAGKKNFVVSCGGGTPLRSGNVEWMKKSGRVVLLTAPAQTLYERVKEDTGRPLLPEGFDVEYIKKMLKERQACYESAADITVCTQDKPVSQICEELINELKRMDRENV